MLSFEADKTKMRLLFIPWQGNASLARREEPKVGADDCRGWGQGSAFPGMAAGGAFGREWNHSLCSSVLFCSLKGN